MSAEYNFRFRIDWNIPRFDLDLTAGYIGQVKVLGYPVVGAPSQEAINTAVAQYISEHPGSLAPLSPAVKAALLQIAEKVVYVDDQGQNYYGALYAALNATAVLQITAVYTQTGTVYDTDTLDSLKADLVVTAYYDDGTTADVTSASVLSGTLTEGTSTITATYQEKTATFNVTVTEAPSPVVPEGYTAVEYIANSSTTAYNTLNVTLTSTDEVEIRLGMMATGSQSSSSGGYPVVCKQTSSGNTVGYGVLVNQNPTYIGTFDGTLCSIEPNGGSSIQNIKYDIVATKSPTGLSITDGTHSNSATTTPRAIATSLYVFSMVKTMPFKGRIYYMDIYVNNVLASSLHPCIRVSDNKNGFWDSAQERFIYDNSYTAGPVVTA